MAIDLTGAEAAVLPSRLAALHRSTTPGERRQVRFHPTVDMGRRTDIAQGAGFSIVRGAATTVTTLERFRTLPDTVAPHMQVLIVGLNPSPAAADAGVGFARPGNRFWPAALAAGLARIVRDPDDALVRHGMGMTDIVKRTTRRADELRADEFRDGLARIERLAEWLEPRVICFVGLAGWRTAVDRSASAGWQPDPLGGSPAYVMPSTSGLNASSQLGDFIAHMRQMKLVRRSR